MGLEIRQQKELERKKELKSKEQDTENVFEIRKLFKFGSELQDFIKTKEKV